jgi:uncharacterized phage protein (TIGR02220 family)
VLGVFLCRYWLRLALGTVTKTNSVMSKSRTIHTKVWTDTWFENLDVKQKLLFIYLLTNDKTNMLGIYEISLRKISFDTGLSNDEISKILDQFSKDNKIFYKENHIILSNFLKHQSYNPNMKKSALMVYNELPKALKGLDKQLDISNLAKAWVSLYEALGKTYLMLPKIEVEVESEIEKENEEESVSHTSEESHLNNQPSAGEKKIAAAAAAIIDHLNLKTNSAYRSNTAKTKSFISARMNEGFTVDDFKIVIDKKYEDWKDDPKMAKYIRPETLFGNKFEGYLNEKQIQEEESEDAKAKRELKNLMRE